jgi:hypothetical protein
MRTALFWVIMQWVVVIYYQCCGTTNQSHLQGSRIQKKAYCPNTNLIWGRVWAVESLSSMVPASRVVTSGWEAGEWVSPCRLEERLSITRNSSRCDSKTEEHSHEQSERKDKEGKCNIWLTLYLLMWRIRWAPNDASKWQMGFNSPFKGLINR